MCLRIHHWISVWPCRLLSHLINELFSQVRYNSLWYFIINNFLTKALDVLPVYINLVWQAPKGRMYFTYSWNPSLSPKCANIVYPRPLYHHHSLDIYFFGPFSVNRRGGYVCENPSKSAVSELLWIWQVCWIDRSHLNHISSPFWWVRSMNWTECVRLNIWNVQSHCDRRSVLKGSSDAHALLQAVKTVDLLNHFSFLKSSRSQMPVGVMSHRPLPRLFDWQ